MEPAFILASLALTTLAYLFVSIQDKSFINVMTPGFVVFVPANYFLEMFHYSLFGPSGTTYAYFLSYASYAAYYVAWAFGYSLRCPALRLPFSSASARGSYIAPYVLLAAAVALYLPVLLEFREIAFDPRAIYAQTRSGYGANFFLSTALCYLALVLLLFKKNLALKELAPFTLFAMGFMWLHGSKHHMIVIIFMMTMYWVYVRGNRVSLARFAIFIVSFVIFGLCLFLLTTPDLVMGNGLTAISQYSDYTRNGMLVIDSHIGPLYGKLSMEMELYSRVPRLLFPDKPKDFGMFYLAKYFFPENFEQDAGAPDFGYGMYFADFGVLTPLIMLVIGFGGGVMVKTFVMGLRKYRGPGDFVLVLFGVGLPLIPLGGVFLLPESILLALVANMLHSMRISPRPVRTPSTTAME